MAWRPSWWLDALKFYWPLNLLMVKASRLPIVGPLITTTVRPFFNEKNFNISYIPIQAKIDPPISSILTEGIIVELIRRSAHRVVIKRCTCRDAKGCENFPIEDSCLLLGMDTQFINPEIANHISIDEALEHMKRKIALGLIPMTGRVRMDNLYYGAPNRGRMLTICFCCPCCCSVLATAKYFPQEFRASIVPLKGIEVVVDDSRCAKCGSCVDACFLDAISFENGKIVHSTDLCISCGRCSSVCPQGATHLKVDDSQTVVDDLLGRINERVDVG
jgi:ferredoxin